MSLTSVGNSKSRFAIKRLMSLLRALERDGKHCADEAIFAGLFIGAGSIQLAEKLHQSNEFGFQLLVNLSLTLVGPIASALLITMRLCPYWVRNGPLGLRNSWPRVAIPAALIGFVLNFYFFLASVIAGVLISSRQDVIGEFRQVFTLLKPTDLLLSCLEAGVYVTIASTWALVESRASIRNGRSIALVMSSVTVHVFAVVMVAKIAWIFLLQSVF